MKTIVDPNISLTDFYNPAVAADQQFIALAAAFDPLLRQFVLDLQRCIIYASIRNQPEWLLDYLALYCFSVDYYDINFDLQTKIRLVEAVILDKATKGSPAALVKLLRIAFEYAEIKEWWQMQPPGPPNTFQVWLSQSEVYDPVKAGEVLRLVLLVKNARSWFGGLFFFATLKANLVYCPPVMGAYYYDVLR